MVGAVKTKHNLLTGAWSAAVERLEAGIGRITIERPVANDCQIAFFEIAGDDELHVNVTHHHPTAKVRGWSGPANLPEGFVHNRRFAEMTSRRMLQHIREMVFAERI